MAAAIFGLVLALGIGGVHITGTALAVGLAAAVFYAGLIILNQMIKGFSGLQLTAAELVIAAVVMLCYVLLRGGSIRLPGNEGGTAALLVLCTVNTALACYLYFSSMNRLRARTVALLGYIDPVVGPRIRGCFPEREHDRAADFSGLPSCWLARLTGSRAGKSGFDKPPGAVYNRQ